MTGGYEMSKHTGMKKTDFDKKNLYILSVRLHV